MIKVLVNALKRIMIKSQQESKSAMVWKLLFMRTKEYLDIGYRQGINEILSFMLLAIELDYQTQLSKNMKSTLFHVKNNMLHNTHALFEMITCHLSPSCDARTLKHLPQHKNNSSFSCDWGNCDML